MIIFATCHLGVTTYRVTSTPLFLELQLDYQNLLMFCDNQTMIMSLASAFWGCLSLPMNANDFSGKFQGNSLWLLEYRKFYCWWIGYSQYGIKISDILHGIVYAIVSIDWVFSASFTRRLNFGSSRNFQRSL